MACFLPFRPWLSPDLRVFEPSRPLGESEFISPSESSLALRRHLSVFASQASPFDLCLMPTMIHSRTAPRTECLPFSISGSETPSFHFLTKASGSHLPCAPEVPPVGFGYPFDGIQVFRPSETSFSLQRSWASPFRAFLRHVDREMLSQSSFRPRTFLQGLVGPCIGASTVSSHRTSRTQPCAPDD